MPLSENGYLLDVNVLYALMARNHIHHPVVEAWFYADADLRWAICPFTEAGFLRNATASRAGQIDMALGVNLQVLDVDGWPGEPTELRRQLAADGRF